MRFLRRFVGVTRMDHIRNTDIREAINTQPLLHKTEQSQLRWYGHVLRMDSGRLVRRIFEARPLGRRPVGRPRTRWADQVANLIRRAGHAPEDAELLAADRTKWKAVTTSLPPRPERIRRAL